MKNTRFSAQMARRIILTGILICAALAAVHAQLPNGTLLPSVCFEAKPETLTRTLVSNLNPGPVTGGANSGGLQINETVPPGYYTIVFNPGGATQETLIGRAPGNSMFIYFSQNVPADQEYLYAHAAGETVHFISAGDAVYGYNNTSDAAITLPRGILTRNYFSPGFTTYSIQPVVFQPGVHQDVLRLKMIPGYTTTWFLNGGQATPNPSAEQSCAIITYQGRLSDGGNAANGQFDLQFQTFDTVNGGAAQSDLITVENVQVTNGVFTVQLFFGAAFSGNSKARFLQIGVRPGISTDAFNILTPRQPIADVPYAINAQTAAIATNATNSQTAVTATSATNADKLGNIASNQYVLTTDPRLSATNNPNFIQNATTPQTGNFNISGSGAIGGNLTVGGALSANLGQSANTVFGTNSLNLTSSATDYALIPGLAQTVNVPANSSVTITTDGGIYSSGAVNTFTVADVAIFVDGSLVSVRRIVVSNNPVPQSIGNWSLSLAQTPSAGSHTIEVKARYGLTGSANAAVSSGSDPLLKGQLTVSVIKN